MAGGRIRLESTPGRGSTVRILLPLEEPETAPAGAEAPARDGTGRPAPASGAVGVTEAEGVGAPRLVDAGRGSVVGGERMPSALIAVVEDEPGVRTLVERILVRGGYRVLAFPDGAAALDALAGSGTEIDLLLTDLVMPGPNGFEMARTFRRDRPDLPVLLMSGYAADALDAEGIAAGSIEILAKPFSAAELLAGVASILRPVNGGA